MVNKMFTLMELTKTVLAKQKHSSSPKAGDGGSAPSSPATLGSPGNISKKMLGEDRKEDIKNIDKELKK